MRMVMKEGAQLIDRKNESPGAVDPLRFGDTARGSASCMYVPIHSGEAIVGVLAIQSYTPRAYSREDLGLLQTLADHCGGALQRIQMAEAVQRAEAKYRSIFENSSEGIFQTTPEGRLLSANSASALMLGYETPEELLSSVSHIGRQLYVIPERREDLRRLVETQGLVKGFEAELYRKNGSKTWVSLNIHAVRDGNGAIQYFEGAFRDITERKQVLRRLSDALELNQVILATSSVGMLAFRASGRCVFANEAASLAVGAAVEQLLRMNFRQTASWQKYGLLEMAEETLRSGKPQRRELYMVTTFGKEAWLDIHMARFVAGGEEHLFVLHRDIADHKRAEEALRVLSLRLRRAQDEERRHIARELHDSTAQKLIGLALSLSRLDNLRTGKHPALRKLVRSSLTLAEDCAKEVRTLSYLLHPPLLDQLGLAAACQAYLQGFAVRSDIHVSLDVPDNLGRLPADAELALFRVVQEGLANIHRHSGSKSATIRLRHAPDHVSLEVSDRGHGLPPAALEALQHGNGRAGLGLISMRERLSELGGRLDIESGTEGTTLRAILPRGTAQL
jgi:PAS domain S-box-containing protein